MHDQPQVFIFTALLCEAKPLIAFWRLKKISGGQPFAIYAVDNMVLAVTGVGKVAMATAVAYCLALYQHKSYPVVLNVGVAGHQTYGVGGIYRAIKITDQDSGDNYYPASVAANKIACSALICVSKAVSAYSGGVLYDMESSAFYPAACRFSTGELVQCLKIISDNEFAPIKQINSKKILGWIHRQLPQIDGLLQDLLALSAVLSTPNLQYYRQIVGGMHFSNSRQIQLKTLLRKWQVLTDNSPLPFDITAIKSANQLLEIMQHEIEKLTFIPLPQQKS